MISIYTHLREKNPQGIPYRESVQLFLWIFSTLDILPVELRGSTPGRQELVDIFSKLELENIVIKSGLETVRAQSDQSCALDWDALIAKLLSGEIALDPSFPQRASKYI